MAVGAEMNEHTESSGPAKRGLGKSIATMGVATAADIVVQIAIPILLVRFMTEADFGLYRTLWLIAGTVPGVLALGMPVSLYYFLPRSEHKVGAVYVVQAAIHMFVAGCIAAVGTAIYVQFHGTEHSLGPWAAAFVGLWVFATLLDFLFVARQAVPDQVRINLSFAVLRVVLVLAAAFAFRSWPAVLAAHIAVVLAKAIVCLVAVRRFTGPGVWPTRHHLLDQYRYGLPVGASMALYLLRSRLDQWLVASLFSVAQFGLYSIAAVFTPLQTLIRITVNQVIQPELSRMQANDDLAGIKELGRRSNLAVALLLFPSIAFIGLWAEDILAVLFTNRYSGAAPVVRIYLLVMAIESMDIAMILMAMRQGRFLMIVDAIALPVAIGSAFLGAHLFGMAGAAAGGVVGALVAQMIIYPKYGELSETRFGMIQDWSAIGRVVLASAIACAASTLVSRLDLPGGLIVELIFAGVIFTIAYRLALPVLGLSSAVSRVFGERLSRLAGFGR